MRASRVSVSRTPTLARTTRGSSRPSEHAELIAAARAAADALDYPLFINGRTELYIRRVGPDDTRLEEAARRLQLYVEAGADGAFCPGITDAEEIGELAERVAAPLNVLWMPSMPYLDELERLGVRRVTVGSQTYLAALSAVERIAEGLKERDLTPLEDLGTPSRDAVRRVASRYDGYAARGQPVDDGARRVALPFGAGGEPEDVLGVVVDLVAAVGEVEDHRDGHGDRRVLDVGVDALDDDGQVLFEIRDGGDRPVVVFQGAFEVAEHGVLVGGVADLDGPADEIGDAGRIGVGGHGPQPTRGHENDANRAALRALPASSRRTSLTGRQGLSPRGLALGGSDSRRAGT